MFQNQDKTRKKPLQGVQTTLKHFCFFWGVWVLLKFFFFFVGGLASSPSRSRRTPQRFVQLLGPWQGLLSLGLRTRVSGAVEKDPRVEKRVFIGFPYKYA